MPTLPAVIELDGVGRNFQAGSVSVSALSGISERVLSGEYVAITGPSGSGKSTLLNILGLLDSPDQGTYLLDGVDTATLGEGERAGLRSRHVGFVFQAFHLLNHRTVLENVMLATKYNGTARGDRRTRAMEALAQVGLPHRVDFMPSTLSGGERQRVAIARALVTRPSVLLCDEPTGNLDSATGTTILEVFGELHDAGMTLVVVTHSDLVSSHAERTIRLLDGRVTH